MLHTGITQTPPHKFPTLLWASKSTFFSRIQVKWLLVQRLSIEALFSELLESKINSFQSLFLKIWQREAESFRAVLIMRETWACHVNNFIVDWEILLDRFRTRDSFLHCHSMIRNDDPKVSHESIDDATRGEGCFVSLTKRARFSASDLNKDSNSP
jgi:hypothetical protein